MESPAATRHPVWQYLAVVRAARDFGLAPEQLKPLTLRFRLEPGSVEAFAEAVADAVLERSS